MAQYYYADEAQNSVGPMSMDELRLLRASGVVSDSTPVFQEGATTWRRYGEYAPPTGERFSSYAPPPPPPGGRAHEDLIREQIAARATRAAAVAGSTASLIQTSVLQTLRSAGTPGEKAVVFASLTGLVAFFLPWAGASGSSISGFGLARQASGLLWLLPVSLGGTFFLSYLNIKSTPGHRILRARWFLLIGAFWAAISLLATVAGQSLFGVASVGLYLTLLSTAALAAGGFMQIGENVGPPPEL